MSKKKEEETLGECIFLSRNLIFAKQSHEKELNLNVLQTRGEET